MGLLRNHFESGTNGLAITVANSTNSTVVDTDAFSRVNPNSGTITFVNTRYMHGSFAGKISPVASSTSLIALGTFSTATIYASRAYMQFTALPSAAVQFMWHYNLTSAASVQQFNYSTDGRVQAARPSGALDSTAANFLTLNHWYRFEMVTSYGTSGYQKWGVYDGDGTTALYEYNTGTIDTSGYSAVSEVRLGKGTTSPSWGDIYVDDFAATDQATGYIGPYVQPPTAVTTETNGVSLINSSGSTSGIGGTLSYAISPTTNTTVVQPGIWTVLQQSTSQTFTVTISESGSIKTATSTVVVPAKSAGTVMRTYNGSAWVSS